MTDAAIAPPIPSSFQTPNPSEPTMNPVPGVDPMAIATQLNQYFQPQGITLRASWKGDYLVLLAEAKTLPPMEHLLPQVQRQLESLQLVSLHRVHFYGTLSGQPKPQWGRKIILSPPALPPPGEPSLASASVSTLADWLSQGDAGATISPPPIAAQPVEESRFLRCVLSAEDTILIPLIDIQSVFTTRLSDIVPVPDMPDAVLGVQNHRGEMLWMVDLNAQLGMETPIQDGYDEPKLTTIVITHRNTTIGFVTPAAIEIETRSAEPVHGVNAALFSPDLAPYLAGYLQESGSPVLDVSALINPR